MGGIGGMELLIIGLVALIVVGPKDLPKMFRTVGQFTGKAKRMAREFTSAMEAAADDAGVSEVSKTLKAATNPKKMGLDAVQKAIDPTKYPEGSSTQKLAEDRAEAAKKIHEATAKVEAGKRAAEQKAKEEAAAQAATKTKPKAKTKKPKKAAKPKAVDTKSSDNAAPDAGDAAKKATS